MRGTFVNVLTVLGIAVSPFAAQADPFVFVANSGEKTLTVIDAATNQKVDGPVPLTDKPVAIAIVPNGKFACVVGSTSGGGNRGFLDVIDTTQRTKRTQTFDREALDVVLAPDGQFIYVLNRDLVRHSGSVTVVDAGSLNKTQTVEVGDGVQRLAISPKGTVVYVARQDQLNGFVTVIDTTVPAKAKKVADRQLGTKGAGAPTLGELVVTPDGEFAYIAFRQPHRESGDVEIIDTKGNEAKTVAVGLNPRGIAFTPNGKSAYVANSGDNSVSVIDTGNKTVKTTVKNVGAKPTKVAISPSGQRAYVLLEDFKVSILDSTVNPPTKRNEAALGSTAFPDSVAFTPDGKYAFVTVPGASDNTVKRIDTKFLKVTSVGVGIVPKAFAITPIVIQFTSLKGDAQGATTLILQYPGNTAPPASLNMTGKFTIDRPITFQTSTITIESLLNEDQGFGESIQSETGSAVLPVVLSPRAGNGIGGGIYESDQSLRPTFRLDLKGDIELKAYDLTSLDVTRPGITLPAQCRAGNPTTKLTTRLLIIKPAFVIETKQNWKCDKTELSLGQ